MPAKPAAIPLYAVPNHLGLVIGKVQTSVLLMKSQMKENDAIQLYLYMICTKKDSLFIVRRDSILRVAHIKPAPAH
jgi:hypothetical protein